MSGRRARTVLAGALAALVTIAPAWLAPTGIAVAAPDVHAAASPTSVTLLGSMQSEIGCPGDWDPGCAASHLTRSATAPIWVRSFALPAGSYDFKVAINDSWDETYGWGGVQGGPQITVNLPSAATVRFYYDERTHLVSDSVNDVIATAVGDFQNELGCPGDWQPDCLVSLLADPDNDGIDTLVTTAIPAGTYNTVVAMYEKFDVTYGAGGVKGGANIVFNVPANGATTTFTFDESTHIMRITSAPAQLRVTTSPALAADISVDGVQRDSWGLNWVPFDVGSHQVCFGPVPGFAAPPCQTVSLTTATTTSVVGTYTARGYLRVVTSPAVASTISVDGVPRNDWGLWAEVAPGTYNVCFGNVAGFAVPACRNVTVTAGATATTTGTFTASAAAPGPSSSLGLLRVVTFPAVAGMISVDGQWRDNWGLNWMRIGTGSHQVCFGALPYAEEPPCTSTTVTAGATSSIAVNYVLKGSLRVVTSPAVPAVIKVNGVVANVYGMWAPKPVGSYTVCFGPVAGKTAPPCQTGVSVTAGATTTVTGTYT